MKCLLFFTALLFLITLAIYTDNSGAGDDALHKAGYVGLNAFEYVAKELDKH